MKYNDKHQPHADDSAPQSHHHHHYYAEQSGYQFNYGLRISTTGLIVLVGVSIAALLILFAFNRANDSLRRPADNVNTRISVMPAETPAHDLIKQPPALPAPTPRQFKLRRNHANTQSN